MVGAIRQVVVLAAKSEAEVCPDADGKSPAWLSWSRIMVQRWRRLEVTKSDRGGIRVNKKPPHAGSMDSNMGFKDRTRGEGIREKVTSL